jgi:O-antigen/teichoic acid export membrane protein
MILTVVTNLIFIPNWGITGAAFASFISTTIYAYLKFQTTLNKFGFQPYDKKYMQIIGLTLLVYFLVNNIPPIDNLYLSILVISLCTVMLFASGSYLMAISQEFNNLLKDSLTKFRKGR